MYEGQNALAQNITKEIMNQSIPEALHAWLCRSLF